MKKTEGIILSELRFRDTSKILTIYTKELGKISVMAKGAYRPKSKLLASTQPFSYNEFQFSKGKNFYYINQIDIIDTFYNIRNKIERIAFGFFILELLDKSIIEEEKNEKVFGLLAKSLKILSNLDRDYLKFITSYELKYVSFLGYRPEIGACVNCNNKNTKMSFSKTQGGLLCNNCNYLDSRAKFVSNSEIELMQRLLFTSLDHLDEIEVNLHVLTKIQDLLMDYILYNIDISELKSLKLLKSWII